MKITAKGIDPSQAIELCRQHIRGLRRASYEELLELFEPRVERKQGGEGLTYEFESQSFWDDREHGNVRVIVRVDAAKSRTERLKIVDDFIMAPDGSFVGE